LNTNETSRVRRFRQGEIGAFNELYDEFGDRLYRFCTRLTGDKDDAEDLMAEVFLAAYEGRERFEGRSSVSTWLYRIAVYQWNRMRRSRKTTMRLDDTQEIAVREHGIGEIALEQALGTLPDTLSQAFVLVKCEQLCYREAAEVLGIPMGTIQFRVHEASLRLRKALQEVMPEVADPLSGPEPVRGCM
jgi:RNA polymerase sigma-70 factor, ECF subfamily